jgi:site-specific DNA-methyltransferase (adenine-specific)
MDAVATRIGAEGHTINPMTGREIVNIPRRNHHPTVKPTDLMRYLCRLVTPPGGVVLDPFMGSGSTGKAAMLEGFRFVGVEREAEYVVIARGRIGGEVGLFHGVG